MPLRLPLVKPAEVVVAARVSVLALPLVVLASACSSSAAGTHLTTPASATPSRTASVIASPSSGNGSSSTAPDRELCKVSDVNGGTIYLWVTSAAQHNFAACTGATMLPTGTDVFSLSPSMDRRCVNDKSVSSDGALIAVYSSAAKADIGAARALCSARGWSED